LKPWKEAFAGCASIASLSTIFIGRILRQPIADTVEALIKCKEAGKIRYIGVSNFSSEQIRQAHAVHSLATVQVPYNLLQRQAESDVLPCCDELGIRAVAYGPLAQGLLTGKYGADAKFDSDDRRSRLSHFQKETLKENLASVERLEVIGKQYEKKPARLLFVGFWTIRQ
jgi:aryl-alcohol dehydrogenase-like predicted oxidoreductase